MVGTGFALVAVVIAAVSLRSGSEEPAAVPMVAALDAEDEAAEVADEDREPVLA